MIFPAIASPIPGSFISSSWLAELRSTGGVALAGAAAAGAPALAVAGLLAGATAAVPVAPRVTVLAGMVAAATSDAVSIAAHSPTSPDLQLPFMGNLR